MNRTTLWTAVAVLTTTLVGCAYGSVSDPYDEVEDQLHGGSNYGPPQPGSIQGSCYLDQGICNPMTSSCGLGEACDLSGLSYQFQCYAPPNDALIGSSCDPTVGPFCRHGSVCIDSVCRAYCCSNDDCLVGSCEAYDAGGLVQISACTP